MSLEIGNAVLEAARKKGASYADVRIGEVLDEHVTVKKGLPDDISLRETNGFGVRVIVDGSWGFAGSVFLTKSEAVQTAQAAVSVAKASSKAKKKRVALTPSESRKGKYSTKMKKDPFKVPLDEKIDVLLHAERTIAGQSDLIKSSSALRVPRLASRLRGAVEDWKESLLEMEKCSADRFLLRSEATSAPAVLNSSNRLRCQIMQSRWVKK
jgi:predicted Zn-dependent protease